MELFEVFWVLAVISGIVTIILARVAKREREQIRFEQRSHVKVLESPYDWAKDEDLNDA